MDLTAFEDVEVVASRVEVAEALGRNHLVAALLVVEHQNPVIPPLLLGVVVQQVRGNVAGVLFVLDLSAGPHLDRVGAGQLAGGNVELVLQSLAEGFRGLRHCIQSSMRLESV